MAFVLQILIYRCVRTCFLKASPRRGEALAKRVVRVRLLMLQNGVILKASPRWRSSRVAGDEGAKPYGTRNWRTLIRRLRRHLPYLREGFKKFNFADKHQFSTLHSALVLPCSRFCALIYHPPKKADRWLSALVYYGFLDEARGISQTVNIISP